MSADRVEAHAAGITAARGDLAPGLRDRARREALVRAIEASGVVLVAADAEGARGTSAGRDVQIEIADRGSHGVWLSWSGGGLGGFPQRLADATASPIRHYRARLDRLPSAVLTVTASTWWPSPRPPAAIVGVQDRRFLSAEEQSADPHAIVRGTVDVAVALQEGWEWADATIERWRVDPAI